MKRILPKSSVLMGTSSLFILACGNQVTQFSSPDYAGATYSLSGSATDKTKSIKKALESADATSVLVESGMSEQEKMNADAEENAILETLFPPESAGSAPGAVTEAEANAAAAKAAADAAKTQAEAAAKAAAKRAHDRDEEEKKGRSGKKSEEEEREDDDDERDFSDDGDFESSLPRVVVGDDAAAFREACAQAMKADKKKLVIAGEGKGNLSKDSVLVVYAVGGSLTVKPEGEKFRGLCVFASGGANVKINAGKTRVNGLYIYERGNNNKTNANFLDSGRFKSGVVMFSGNSNAVTIKGVNDCKCKKLKVYGSPGSVVCGKR